MKYFLSSYKFGLRPEQLPQLFQENKSIGLIMNAIDFSTEKERIEESLKDQMQSLQDLGLIPFPIDLREYFHAPSDLRKTIHDLGGLWVRGGNTFVLRAAFHLSGLDMILTDYAARNNPFVYAGYSAGVCVLQPSLRGIDLVDDPGLVSVAYGADQPVIWNGLGILTYHVAPHFQSDHPESGDIDAVVAYYKSHKLAYKPLKDGDVLVIQ